MVKNFNITKNPSPTFGADFCLFQLPRMFAYMGIRSWLYININIQLSSLIYKMYKRNSFRSSHSLIFNTLNTVHIKNWTQMYGIDVNGVFCYNLHKDWFYKEVGVYMHKLIKPRKLCKGDTIATISLSGGRAGDIDMIER